MLAELFFNTLVEPYLNQTLADEQALTLAIQEAYKGAGYASPNPLVGCVILDSKNQFITKGYHKKVGHDHAEIDAIKKLTAEQLKNAKVFVTLEPCAHQGRTGSCAKKLAELPISEVVYGLQDPNPLVQGKGHQILVDGGKKVTCWQKQFPQSTLNALLEQVAEHFLHNFRNQKVFFSLKAAVTLDGMIGMKNGDSKWITDDYSRQCGHFLRAYHDAVLVGAQTIQLDNPSLNLRFDHSSLSKSFVTDALRNKKNKIIILDPKSRIFNNLKNFKISQLHQHEDLVFVIQSEKFVDSTVRNLFQACQLIFTGESDFIQIENLQNHLWPLGIRSVYVEGGPKTLSQFLHQKAGQRLYLFQAPIMLGGINGRNWCDDLIVKNLNSKISLMNQSFKKLQKDFFVTGLISY